MKKLFFLLLTSHFLFAQQTKYVTPTGGGLHNGINQANAWTLPEAFSNATPGMTVFIKAGNYNSLNYIQSINGTNGNTIKFIGCDSNFNPIITLNRATYTRNDTFSSSDIPYINDGLANGQIASNGICMNISGDYVEFSNIAIRGYATAFVGSGDNQVFKNINTDFNGDFRKDNATHGFDYYLGIGQRYTGNNVTVSNSFCRDADAQGFNSDGNNGSYSQIEVMGTSTNNTMDYYFLNNGTNNTVTDIDVYRTPGNAHLGHGYCIKPTGVGDTATGNVLTNFLITNTTLEFQFGGASNNTAKNGQILKEGTTEWSTSITIANGAHDNIFENILIKDSYSGVVFNDWDDGAGGVSEGDLVSCGVNNKFYNLVISGVDWGIYFRRQGSLGSADGNYFYNTTFYDCNYLFRTEQANTDTRFYNTIIDNVPNFAQFSGGAQVPLNPNTMFNYINVTNGLSISNFNTFLDTNITSTSFAFANVTNDHYSMTTSALDIGFDFELTEQRLDFEGITRTIPFTLGAYEYVSNSINSCSSFSTNSDITPIEIIVSNHDGHGPCNLMDNNLDSESRWSAIGDGEWIQFDLGQNTEFDQLQIAFYLGNNRSTSFDIQASIDAITWYPVVSGGQSSGNSLGFENFDFTPKNARYVKYIGHGNTNNNWNSIKEVKINKVNIPVTNIAITTLGTTLDLGQNLTLEYNISPSNATNKTILWNSSDTSVATVDNNLITTTGTGTATITVTTADGSYTATINITVIDCPNSIANESTDIEKALDIASTNLTNGLDVVAGTSINTTGSDCAISITNSDNNQPWARYEIELKVNDPASVVKFMPGDSLSIRIDGKSILGNARLEIAQNNNTNSSLESFNFNNSWSSFETTFVVPQQYNNNDLESINIWLFSNYNQNNFHGNAVFDNLIIEKIPVITCANNLSNDATSNSIDFGITSFSSGLDSVIGTSSITNGSSCALEIINNDANQPWAKYVIPINLVNNNIVAGDQIFISIDGNATNGAARIELTQDNNPNTGLIFHSFNTEWSTHSQTISVPTGLTTLDIWLFSNYNQSTSGTAVYDNLIVQKVNGTSLKISNSIFDIEPTIPEKVVSIFPNPSSNEIKVSLGQNAIYTKYTIYSTAGVLVQQGNIKNQEELLLNLSSINKGMYILHLLDTTGRITYRKIIKE